MPSGSSTLPSPKRTCAEATTREGHRLPRYLALLLGLLAALGIGFLVGTTRLLFVPVETRSSMTDCLNDKPGLLKQATTPGIKDSTENCYSLLRDQELLNSYAIWYRANAILFWMVVAITLFGVVLAAVQIVPASYKLAALRRSTTSTDTNLTLKRDEVVLKSSITGLFILFLSFVFFLVFVQFVYRLDIPKNYFDSRPDSKGAAVAPGTGSPAPTPEKHE